MVDDRLDTYIKTELRKDRTISEIRLELVSKGVNPTIVDSHINNIFSGINEPKRSWNIRPGKVFLYGAIGLAVVAIIAVVTYLLMSGVVSFSDGPAATDEKSDTCGNGLCESYELVSGSCPQDCGTPKSGDSTSAKPASVCGNGLCESSELVSKSCPQDCELPGTSTQENVCGNGICDGDELMSKSCPQDCGTSGDGTGTAAPKPASVCGNGLCESSELVSKSCPEDCEA